VLIGSMAIGTVEDWVSGPVPVVSWHASRASLEKARRAPISAVPASYIQTQHLRRFCESAAQGHDYSRLLTVAHEIAGQCDIRVMTHVINAQLRRRDTYHSWFEYTDAKHIVRHTIADPADVEFIPINFGEMTTAKFRTHILATPGPLHWDCFTFGVIQYADHFTFYMSFDHLLMDAVAAVAIAMEFHTMYTTLAAGDVPLPLPPAGSYNDFCLRERRHTSALTAESPQVRGWIEFAENNEGTLPDFPLPLGGPSGTATGEILTARLMDEHQTRRFEWACMSVGARFIGGIFACAGLAEHELTGAETYYGITTVDTRSTPSEFMTQGWFTGLIPITVPVAATSFGAAARAAQDSFDWGTEMADVPFDRVLELAPWLSTPRPHFPVLNFFDAGAAPLSAHVTSLGGSTISLYGDGKLSHQLPISVSRLATETAVTVWFPNNPTARRSVNRYVEAMKSKCVGVADGRDPPRRQQTCHSEERKGLRETAK
jgi:hypothetical protein